MPTKNKKIVTFLIIAAAFVSVIGFAADLHNTLTYPGSDFRNRVVGARLMLEGIDPYFFKWQPGLSERFYDPLDNRNELVSKLSVPPTVLTLHAAIAGLSYIQQKIVWLIVQWVAFVGTVWIFLNDGRSANKRKWMLTISFFLANSLFWRLHVNSGQTYILYTFLLAVGWFFINHQFKYGHFISGFFTGMTASLRPSFVLFFVPAMLRKKRAFLLGGTLGFLSSVLFSCRVVGAFIWQQYALTILQMTGLVDLSTYLPVAERTLPNLDAAYPNIIEGFDWRIRNPLEQYFADTSFYLPLNILRVPNERGILLASFVIILVALSLYFIKYVSEQDDTRYAFLFGVLICLASDFFLPIPRYPYYDVQMLLPLLIIIELAKPEYLASRRINAALILGLLLSVVGFLVVPRALFLSAFLIAFYVFVMPIMLLRRESEEAG